jgi:hypothetical protein
MYRARLRWQIDPVIAVFTAADRKKAHDRAVEVPSRSRGYFQERDGRGEGTALDRVRSGHQPSIVDQSRRRNVMALRMLVDEPGTASKSSAPSIHVSSRREPGSALQPINEIEIT